MKNVATVSILTVIAFILGVIGIVIPLTVYFTNIQYKTDNSYFGNIGDWFGGIAGPILSFSSFLIVYAALRLQSLELTEQKQDSQAQRSLNSTKRFEDSFFFLFTQYNQLLSSMYIYRQTRVERFATDEKGSLVKIIDTNKLESEGRGCFNAILSMVSERFKVISMENEQTDKKYTDKSKCCADAYLFIFEQEDVNLTLYFKFLQQILTYVDNSELIQEKEKIFYVDLIKNSMTITENVILYYHCQYDLNDEFIKLKQLVAKYAITENPKEKFLIG